MKKQTGLPDSIRYRYHWLCIVWLRRRALALISHEVPCHDIRLVTLSNQILRHGIEASRLWRRHHRAYPSAVLDPAV